MRKKDFRGVGAGYDISLHPPVPDSKIIRYYSNGTTYYCVWEVRKKGRRIRYLCTAYEPAECHRWLHLETDSLDVAEFWLLNETEGRARR